eukprot:jgi/Chlat1/555/Chrsp103S01006
MLEQFVNFVIRPPRAEYVVSRDLIGSPDFAIRGRRFVRLDLELTNPRGHTLQCSHYTPADLPDEPLPCVVYCHGNSGCRADANEAVYVLLPSNITVFTLDFSGSGLSGGDTISLGVHETEDLRAVVQHLRSTGRTSHIGLWGRSMGAVTSLLYGCTDPGIAGMVLDSPFSRLTDLVLELVDAYNVRVPKAMCKLALAYMRRSILKRAAFDINKLDCIATAPNCFIPALFGHATDDRFILPHHSADICKVYAGDKNMIHFPGDHNSARPSFYFDSITIFFHNTLHPPEADHLPLPHSPPANIRDMGPYALDSPTVLDEASLLHGDIEQEVLWELAQLQSPSVSRHGSVDLYDLDSDGSDDLIAEAGESGGASEASSSHRSQSSEGHGWPLRATRSASSAKADTPREEAAFAPVPTCSEAEDEMLLKAIALSLQESASSVSESAATDDKSTTDQTAV